jgi:hypothetical protein
MAKVGQSVERREEKRETRELSHYMAISAGEGGRCFAES